MRELKPKLMLSSSGGRRRSHGGGWFWSFLTFVIVFLVGVYVGTKVDDFNFTGAETVPVKQAKEQNKTVKSTVKYETSREPVISGDENRIIDTGTSTSDQISTAGEDSGITQEFIKPSPELSVNANEKAGMNDAGLTSINPSQISGETKTTEEAPEAKPVETAQNTANTLDSQSAKSIKKGYTLQVGAFADKARAEKAVNEYRSKGFGAYTVQIKNSKGETWNLVKIGKYSTIEQAWSQSALFKRTVGKDAYVESLGTKTVFNESWGKNE